MVTLSQVLFGPDKHYFTLPGFEHEKGGWKKRVHHCCHLLQLGLGSTLCRPCRPVNQLCCWLDTLSRNSPEAITRTDENRQPVRQIQTLNSHVLRNRSSHVDLSTDMSSENIHIVTLLLQYLTLTFTTVA